MSPLENWHTRSAKVDVQHYNEAGSERKLKQFTYFSRLSVVVAVNKEKLKKCVSSSSFVLWEARS